MSLTHALLGVLESRPMNGYELTKFFDSGARWIWSAPQSQIYTTLRKMWRDGLVEGTEHARTTKASSTVYSITDSVRDELIRWVSAASDLGPPRDSFFLQSLYFDIVDETVSARVLDHFIAENEARIETWQRHHDALVNKETPLIRERLSKRPAEQHDRIARIKAHAFQGEIDRARALVQWAKEAKDIVADGPDDVS